MKSILASSTLFLWEGAALYLGSLSDIEVHRHNAVQVCVGIEEPFRIRLDDNWLETPYVVIPANVRHQLFAARPVLCALVDRDSHLGLGVQEVSTNAKVAPTRFECIPRTIEEAKEAVYTLVSPLERKKVTLESDARIQKAIEQMSTQCEQALFAQKIAEGIGLSESRFLHLFTEHQGLPFRRYALWQKIIRSVSLASKGTDLTTSAHAGGFSDLAHFSRTFKDSFGLSPSKLFKNSRNVQVIL